MKYRFSFCKEFRIFIVALLIMAMLVACTVVAAYKMRDSLPPEPTFAPEPTPRLMVIERTKIQTQYVPMVERVEVPVVVTETEYITVPVSVDDTASNRYSDIELSAWDMELLARIAWREARGEKALGMRMVIEVVLNRVLSSQFPDTVYGVLYQKGQFAPGYGVPELDDVIPTQAQYDAVSLVLNETPITDADVYFFATSALTDSVFMHVGGHYFCKNGNWNY